MFYGGVAAAAVLGVRAACKSCEQKWEAYNMLMLFYSGSYPPNCWRGIFTLVPTPSLKRSSGS